MSVLVWIFRIKCNSVESTKNLILRYYKSKLKYFPSRETIPLKIVKVDGYRRRRRRTGRMRRTRTYGGSRGRPADTSSSPSWSHTSWPSAQSWPSGRSGIGLTRNIIFRENKHFLEIFRQYICLLEKRNFRIS
jgi:hypothetical protein